MDAAPGDPPPAWRGLCTVRFPEGTVRHPRLHSQIEAQLGRFTIFDEDDGGVRIGYRLAASTRAAARAESTEVVSQVLSVLGLSLDAVTEHTVNPPIELMATSAPPPRRLRLVQD
ncbi:MAG: hypothetical protein V9G12_07790 [Microthrixaceae bacterium]